MGNTNMMRQLAAGAEFMLPRGGGLGNEKFPAKLVVDCTPNTRRGKPMTMKPQGVTP